MPAAVPAVVLPPSRLAMEDMLAQGANSVTDLLFSSVSLELGRPAVDKELEGGEYASSLAICNGITKATKSRGFKGFSELLATARVDGDLTLPDRHMEKLQGRLMTTSSPPFHMTTGSRFTQFWSRAKTVSEDGRVVASCGPAGCICCICDHMLRLRNLNILGKDRQSCPFFFVACVAHRDCLCAAAPLSPTFEHPPAHPCVGSWGSM